jgi:hypothetical protein
MDEAFVDLGPPFVADRQATKAPQPSQGAFNDPAIAAYPLADLDPLAGNPDLDASAG